MLFTTVASADEDRINVAKVNTYVDSILGRSPEHKANWSDKTSVQLIDLNKEAGTDFPSGIAYSVIVSKVIKHKYADIQAELKSVGGIYKVVSSVKTQRNFEKIRETPSELSLKLDIKVPIFSDFKTQDHIHIFEDSYKRGILEWSQIGTDGDLAFNRGAVVVEAAGDSSKVMVIGVHVIKPTKKVPWVGRSTASEFAKTHYQNYLAALEEVLSNKNASP